MIQITKNTYEVIVKLPTHELNFDLLTFNEISDNIYFNYAETIMPTKIIREKGNIEDLHMGHWMCLKSRVNAKFNDITMKSLDVEHLITNGII